MSTHLDRIVLSAVAETLENMAFMEVVRDECPPSSLSVEVLSARLAIHEPTAGEVHLTMPHSLLAQVAEAAYALPAEALEEQILRDLLAELLNTIAGRFLTLLLPPEQSYRLGLPELEDADAPAPGATDHLWNFRMEDNRFTLRIRGALPEDPATL